MMVCGVKEGEEEQGHTEIEVSSGFLAGPYPKDYTRRPMPCHACAVQWGGGSFEFHNTAGMLHCIEISS